MYHFRKSENLITEVKLKIFTVFLLFCWLVYLLAKSPPKTVWKFLVSCRCFSWWETCKTGWQVTQNDAWTYFLDGNDLSKFHLYLFLVGMLGHNLLPFSWCFFFAFCHQSGNKFEQNKTLCETHDRIYSMIPSIWGCFLPDLWALMMLAMTISCKILDRTNKEIQTWTQQTCPK